jgi:hypothetical protein
MTEYLRRGSVGAALAVVVAALLIGCSAGPPTAATPIVFDEPPPFDPGPDVGGRALQQAIFADGVVTHDEYERAYTAAIQCMRGEGFEVEGPLRYPDGPLVFTVGADPRLRLTLAARPGDDPEDRFGEVNGRCLAQWSYAVEQVYLRQFAPTEDEFQAWLERAWECARDRGLPLSDPPTSQEASDAVLFGCQPWESDG